MAMKKSVFVLVTLAILSSSADGHKAENKADQYKVNDSRSLEDE